MITQEIVQELFDYREGALYWKKSMMGPVKQGDQVGHVMGRGYRQTKIAGKPYYVHRLIWLYFNGVLPRVIDHADKDKSNNRIENLRDATNAQNMQNTNTRKGRQYKGVSKSRVGRYRARINQDGKEITLGTYATAEEAALAYNEAASRLYGEFASINNLGGQK